MLRSLETPTALYDTLERKRRWWLLSAICAVAGLIHPTLLPSLLAICAWAAWQERRVPWKALLVFLLIFSVWPVRNAVVMHAFIPLRSNFGYELWMGNHPGGNGNFVEALDPFYNAAERARFVA